MMLANDGVAVGSIVNHQDTTTRQDGATGECASPAAAYDSHEDADAHARRLPLRWERNLRRSCAAIQRAEDAKRTTIHSEEEEERGEGEEDVLTDEWRHRAALPQAGAQAAESAAEIVEAPEDLEQVLTKELNSLEREMQAMETLTAKLAMELRTKTEELANARASLLSLQLKRQREQDEQHEAARERETERDREREEDVLARSVHEALLLRRDAQVAESLEAQKTLQRRLFELQDREAARDQQCSMQEKLAQQQQRRIHEDMRQEMDMARHEHAREAQTLQQIIATLQKQLAVTVGLFCHSRSLLSQ